MLILFFKFLHWRHNLKCINNGKKLVVKHDNENKDRIQE